MDYNAIVEEANRRHGLREGLLGSVWTQESKGSTDLGKLGPTLSRNRGNAVGPFQIVPFYHPNADFSTFESQANYAAKLLAEEGLEGYYGTGNAPAGHPTPEQYRAQVLGRLSPDVRMASVNTPPGTPTGDPRTGRMDQPMNIYDPVQAATASLAGMPQGIPAPPALDSSPPSFSQQLAANPLLMAGLSIMGNNGNLGAAGQGIAAAGQQQNMLDLVKKKNAQQAFENKMASYEAGRPEAVTPTSAQKNYEYLISAGVPPESAQKMAFSGGGTTINMGEKLPAGYRWTDPNNVQMGVEPIPGGPATKATEGQANAATYVDMMTTAQETIDKLDAPQKEGGVPGALEAVLASGGVFTNWLRTDEGRQYRNAANLWIRAKLRKESGAVIGEEESQREYEAYFPQPGDDAGVRAQKAYARKVAADSLRNAAGVAWKGEPAKEQADFELQEHETWSEPDEDGWSYLEGGF